MRVYAEFCADRASRLDRYAREHGAGWLWYEPPLAGEAGEGEAPRALWSTYSDQNKSKWGLGSWNCTMGFRRVKAYVARDGKPPLPAKPIPRQRQPECGPTITKRHVRIKTLGETTEKASAREGKGASSAAKAPATKKGARMTRPEDYVLKDDVEAPQVHFDLLLDSGATFPMLYKSDLRALGIDSKTYPAQSASDISAVGGGVRSRLYEVRATVTSDKCQSLVDPKKPVYLDERPELGAVVPVAVVPPQEPDVEPPSTPIRFRKDGTRRKERPETSPGAGCPGSCPS